MRDDDVGTPAASAASTTAWISARPMWPVASTRLWRATTSSTGASFFVERHRAACDAGRLELVLDHAPHGLLRRLRAVLARLVLGVDRRQPDDARAAARRDLDRLGVQAADAGVERDRAERAHPGHCGATTAARSAVGT